MNEYFSEREAGGRPQTLVHIDMTVWKALVLLIEQRISDGSMGYKFPSYCAEGDDVCGTNANDFWVRAEAEVPAVFPTKRELPQEEDPFAITNIKTNHPHHLIVFCQIQYLYWIFWSL